jgi:hypothetical protein
MSRSRFFGAAAYDYECCMYEVRECLQVNNKLGREHTETGRMHDCDKITNHRC